VRQLPIVPLIVFLLAIGVAFDTMFGDRGLSALREAEAKVKAQQRRNHRLQEELDSLRTRVHGLKDDPRIKEQEIRKNLQVRRDDETVFVFVDE
jgi:cell division protein FtsB